MKQKAFVYLGKTQDKKEEVKELCKVYDLDVVFVDDTCLEEGVESLFKKEIQASRWDVYSFDFIMFEYQDDELLKVFYNGTKEKGYHFTHKAVLTKYNRTWKLRALLDEIKEEHEFFQSWEKLIALLKEFDNEKKEKYGQVYTENIMQAYVYTKTQKPNKEEIDAYIEKIEDSKA